MIQPPLDTVSRSLSAAPAQPRGIKRKRTSSRSPTGAVDTLATESASLTSELLLYNANHQVIICRACQYAIQPSALDSHLLRHKIYRTARRNLVESVATLPIRLPEQVEPPAIGCRPIEGLSIVPGWRCLAEGCEYLCASFKRLQRHWTHAHVGAKPVAGSGGNRLGREVHLQTFFRGTKLRYFVVPHDPQDDSDERRASVAPSPPGIAITDDRLPFAGPAAFKLDNEAVRYFHHCILRVVPTLPGSAEAALSWQSGLINTVLDDSRRMPALLAVAAGHSALIATSEIEAASHAAYSLKQSSQHLSYCSKNERPLLAGAARLHALHQLTHAVVSRRWAISPDSATTRPPTPLQLHGILASIRVIAEPFSTPAGHTSHDVVEDVHRTLRLLPLRLQELYGRPSTFHEPWEVLRAIDSLSTCLSANVSESAWAWCQNITPGCMVMIASGSGPALVVVAHWATFSLRRTASRMSWLFCGLADVVLERVLELLEGDPGARLLVTDLAASNGEHDDRL